MNFEVFNFCLFYLTFYDTKCKTLSLNFMQSNAKVYMSF